MLCMYVCMCVQFIRSYPFGEPPRAVSRQKKYEHGFALECDSRSMRRDNGLETTGRRSRVSMCQARPGDEGSNRPNKAAPPAPGC